MSRDGTPALALLDAWRRSGADRHAPARFRFIDALARRAAAQQGEVRALLDRRLAALLDTYAADLERAGSPMAAEIADGPAAPRRPARGALAALADDVAGRALPSGDGAPVPSASYPELAMLDDFRETLTRVRTEGQLRQSLDQAPRNAGPLNSRGLVHHALSLMQGLSPAYLSKFLAYADALSWMEQLDGSGPSMRQGMPPARTQQLGKSGRPRQR